MPARRADLLRMRRSAQLLDDRSAPTPVAVVQRMLAVQAQDFGAACWALGARSAGSTRDDVLAALDDGSIVRSWPMRGTLHFAPPADLRWMLGVTTTRMIAGLTLRHRQLELESEDFTRARDVVTEALSGGRSIGRAELMALWEANGIATAGQRGYHLIYFFAQNGLLCWGPTHKTQQSLVLLDEWAPERRELEPDEALGEFLLRYLTGHGPATLKDFVWWTKGTVAGAKTAVAVLGDRISTLEVDGVEYLATAEQADAEAGTPAARKGVDLLPAFDEYLLGYQDRTPVIDDEHFTVVVPGKNGVFAPILVSAGRVVGTWRRASTSSAVTVEPLPFARLTAAEKTGVRRAATAYGRFLGLPAAVTAED
ncbi:winged helix DNA-binding domain-containing protein [Leifsonia sp. NPDC102414]|uniref:winged helix DNA-binding domain-containing protein n=1 Tax=Leifsonia sp. NPDC102414 TaxID=3364124 RepID=UPI0037FE3636